jgi:hypothetical protein
MYTEGFEDLEKAQNEARHTFVSGISHPEMERLLRENERLKKNLEKEQFFNRLLDQELKDLKSGNSSSMGYPAYPSHQNQGVSNTAFYTLLVITTGLAIYLAYSIYSAKPQPKYVIPPAITKSTAPASATPVNTPQKEVTNGNGQTKVPAVTPNPADPAQHIIKPVVTDSVPNIIAEKKHAATKQKAAVADPIAEYEQAELQGDLDDVTPAAPAPPADNRPVIGKYKVTSKANFYNAPDENSMRSTFINPGGNKIVGAIEEKDDFIFVVYTNDIGYTSKGWLSKKDLSKVN